MTRIRAKKRFGRPSEMDAEPQILTNQSAPLPEASPSLMPGDRRKGYAYSVARPPIFHTLWPYASPFRALAPRSARLRPPPFATDSVSDLAREPRTGLMSSGKLPLARTDLGLPFHGNRAVERSMALVS
jgi:hypothetical protein